jgi:hypothetical protein
MSDLQKEYPQAGYIVIHGIKANLHSSLINVDTNGICRSDWVIHWNHGPETIKVQYTLDSVYIRDKEGENDDRRTNQAEIDGLGKGPLFVHAPLKILEEGTTGKAFSLTIIEYNGMDDFATSAGSADKFKVFKFPRLSA